MSAPDTSRISPTAHYTGYVWCRNGLSHPALATRTGRVLHAALRPADRASARLGGPTLEGMLLARHRMIDRVLERAIERGAVSQIVEVAAGLSFRGARFAHRFRDRGLVYVEGDLPPMSARKRALLERSGLRAPNHHVVGLNALADAGEGSLARVTGELLDRGAGAAIVTEGLASYFDRDAVIAMWRRFSSVLAAYPAGLHVSDVLLDDEIGRVPGTRAFLLALSAFARGRVHLHFRDREDADRAARAAGFATAALHEAGGEAGISRRRAAYVRVLEAWVGASLSGAE